MKKAEIQKGKTYASRNNSSERKVLRMSREGDLDLRPRYTGQDDWDLVEYEVVRRRKGHTTPLGFRDTTTLRSFASWAGRQVD